jgi:phage-related holin
MIDNIMKNISSYLYSMSFFVITPKGWGLLLLSALSAFFTPILPVLITFSCLILADFFTGIWASKKEKKPIQSHIMKNTLVKLALYLIVIVMAFIIQKFIIQVGWFNLVTVVSIPIAITEFKSLCENALRISGNKIFIDIFKSFSDVFKKNKDKIIESGTPPTPEEKQ